MKTRIYQTENNPIFINYDSWATKQLQYNYDDRRAILLWKAERLARLVPAHIHFSTALSAISFFWKGELSKYKVYTVQRIKSSI